MPRPFRPAIAAGAMSSVPQPTIAVDDELTLRPFHFGDADRVIEAFADESIQHWHARRIDSLVEARELIGYGHILWLRERCANFAVADNADRLVGRVAMYTDLAAGTGEIAYWVLPDTRRRGIARRAGGALTDWAHHELGLRRIELEHAITNTASCAVASALGYPFEGIATAAELLADGPNDVHIHAHVVDR